jgi:glycosyltransferase involved in cell wall biosynthesis
MSNWLTDRVKDVSDSVADRWLKKKLVHPRQIKIIPNGIEIHELQSRRRDESADAKEFHWLAVGRLEPVKNYSTMLNAFSMLGNSARLTIAGSGSLRNQLQAEAARLGISSRIVWAGFVQTPEELYARADGFVLTSRWEGLPMSLLEAASWRLPAVASDVPGVRDALPANSHSWLALSGEASGIAENMEKMMKLPQHERRQIGECNFAYVTEHYSLERVLARWEQVYGELLALHPHARHWA